MNNNHCSILILAAALLCSSCGTGRWAGNPNAVAGGAIVGSNVGSSIGGLIGGNRSGWRGEYRGSAIGSVVGALAGAAIGNALSTPKEKEESSPDHSYADGQMPGKTFPVGSDLSGLRIKNIRFVDESRNHVIEAGEQCKIVFDIMNEGERMAWNVIPLVAETSGNRRISISPAVMIEQIAPHSGMKYTASVSAGKKLKEGEVTFRLSVVDEGGVEYDWQEFSLPTKR